MIDDVKSYFCYNMNSAVYLVKNYDRQFSNDAI